MCPNDKTDGKNNNGFLKIIEYIVKKEAEPSGPPF
jgi:hypothetical protein